MDNLNAVLWSSVNRAPDAIQALVALVLLTSSNAKVWENSDSPGMIPSTNMQMCNKTVINLSFPILNIVSIPLYLFESC